MPISKDLFLSILSMDAYNRGYDPEPHLMPADGRIKTFLLQ